MPQPDFNKQFEQSVNKAFNQNEISKENPLFNMDEIKVKYETNFEPTKEDFKRLEDKIDTLHRKINLIFGNTYLINGVFRELKL